MPILVHEAPRSPNKFNGKNLLQDTLQGNCQILKTNTASLKAARGEKLAFYKGIPVSLLVNFFKENLRFRSNLNDTVNVMKEKYCQPQILYPEKSSFRNEGEIKTS